MAKYIKELLVGVIILAIAISVVVAIVNHNSGRTEETNSNTSMSINEAQIKCTLMEEADLVNLMGEPFGDATTAKADKTCRYSWDKANNPSASEEKFIEVTAIDWENRKAEVLSGHTLEEYFDTSTKY